MNTELLKQELPQQVYDSLPHLIKQYGALNTPYRLAHFLAQCSHESANFTRTIENLNYSAERLMQVFSKYFSIQSAQLCARNGEMIANKVYANRMGNGNEASGDGYKYRGRGYIQLTGKSNYATFGKWLSQKTKEPIDLVQNPDWVAGSYPLTSALWFFETNGILELCDMGLSKDVCMAVTKKVNGGTNGIDERYRLLMKFSKLIK